MQDIKVSIIVPVYNAERYVSNCIESMLKQTYENIEIILVNDGSVDSSAEIIDKYAAEDNRIKSIHIENSGVSTARNIALDNAEGEWITFVDSDDWIEPEMIAFAINKAKETNADIVMWTYFKNYANKEMPLSLLPGGNQVITEDKSFFHLKAIYSMYGEDEVTESVSSGTVWCKLYKKTIIDENNLQFKVGLTRAQDTVFSINAVMKASKIVYYEKHLYHYRITNTSTTSGTKFIQNTEEPFNLLLDEFYSTIENYNEEKYFSAFYARTIQVLMWHLKHNYFHPNFRGGIFKRRKEIINLIKKDPYSKALKKIDYNLLPKKEKIMAILLRYKLVIMFYSIYLTHAKIENAKNQRYA
ncbi:glycosyltransferase family 2 protein [Oceanobacillus jeddahense]|uniref:glycosyltransferase family 2 protein n=1 Tax=Oceanobacillus jeddahense TaxID=1462527 RepID=UPI0006948CBE|nr:glycosyltransferase [Oceanobacillus jeddahense]